MSQENPSAYYQLFQWLQATGPILIAITALLVATFQNKMQAWAMKPELDISIDLRPPDCFKIPENIVDQNGQVIGTGSVYYLRLKVINNGNQKAEKVEVFASKLMEEQGNHQWREVISFIPMNLVWANDHSVFYPIISPKMYRHCDLVHIIDPQKRILFMKEDKKWDNVSAQETILSIDTYVKLSTLSSLYPPGRYRLIVLVGATNAKPVEKILEIKVNGSWYEDEEKMLGEGISVKIVR